jgi:pilus assembly protein TadC
MIRTEQRVQALFLFALLGILFLGASLALVTLSWSISAWLVGPFTDAYKGYDRTWYGIVLHFLLWGVYFLAMARVSSAKSY